MKAVQVVAPGKAVFVEVSRPEFKPGHALIRPLKVSLCGSDIRMLHYAAPECYPFPPGTTGHEVVGTVEEVEDSVAAIRPGDRVLALAPGHLAMGEYFLARIEHLLLLPTGRPLEHLLQAQQLGTVIYACKCLPNVVGQDVAVLGQGSAGLWFDFMLRRMGARRVIGIDLDANRLAVAPPFGVTDTIQTRSGDVLNQIKERMDNRLPDLVVEAAGEIDSINLAVNLVRKHGRILFFGFPRGQYFNFNFEQFFHKCCSATTIVGAQEEPDLSSMRMALDLIAAGTADPSPMLTHTFPFEEVLHGYELHHTRGDGAIKIVIDFHPRQEHAL